MDELRKEADGIQAAIECVIPDEVEAAIEFGKVLCVYIARTGKMLADAKMLARKKRSSEISETIIKIAKESCLSTKAQNALVDTIAQEELYLVDWIDRLNAAATHQLDYIRSLISKAKEDMRLQGAAASFGNIR